MGESRGLTGIVRDSRYLDHDTGDTHPESKRRLESIFTLWDETGQGEGFQNITPREALDDEILLAHSPEHLSKIVGSSQREYTTFSQDTFASSGSHLAARLAVGGLCTAISLVVSGELKNAFALVRPPGHHAERTRAMGFCLFNNVAVGARYAREILGLKRVLIVDWDVHHGNGTQHCFERDDAVLFFSTHQFPLFPGTGHFTETGLGPGEGMTINVPLRKGYGDAEYADIFRQLLLPPASEFSPDLILVSAGFDTHRSDPLGGMNMTAEGFAVLTRMLMNLAEACCRGRLVLCLEGGYNLKALAMSVRAVLRELAGLTVSAPHDAADAADKKKVDYALKRSRPILRRYWKNI